jgi:hypothetical protein
MPFCAAPTDRTEGIVPVQIGGYVRIAADQRWLQTVIRFQAGHRAKRRLGA